MLLGTSFQWVSQLEAGRNVTLHSLARIANALHVSLVDLLSAPRSAAARRVGRPPRTKRDRHGN